MDKHKLLKDIKVFLGLEEMPSPTYTLADGTPIEISELVAGGTVIVGDGPAPAGEHILSDGQTIVVDENGVITEIRPVAAPTEMTQPPEPAPTQLTPEQMQNVAQKFAVGTAEERLGNLEVLCRALMEYSFGWELREATQKAIKDQALSVYKTQVGPVETKVQAQTDAFAKMVVLMEEILKMPTVSSEPPKQTFSKTIPESKTEKYGKILKQFQTIKN